VVDFPQDIFIPLSPLPAPWSPTPVAELPSAQPKHTKGWYLLGSVKIRLVGQKAMGLLCS